ncbi:hypothetical protein AFAE65S_04264 [Alcaligenes phenolicus]
MTIADEFGRTLQRHLHQTEVPEGIGLDFHFGTVAQSHQADLINIATVQAGVDAPATPMQGMPGNGPAKRLMRQLGAVRMKDWMAVQHRQIQAIFCRHWEPLVPEHKDARDQRLV